MTTDDDDDQARLDARSPSTTTVAKPGTFVAILGQSIPDDTHPSLENRRRGDVFLFEE